MNLFLSTEDMEGRKINYDLNYFFSSIFFCVEGFELFSNLTNKNMVLILT